MEPMDLDPVHAAIVDGVCLMIAADGIIEDAELEFFYGMLCSLLGVEVDVSAALIANSLARLSGSNVQSFLDAIIERLRNDDEAQEYLMVALQLAAMADGHGHESEVVVLDAFAERFQMSDEEVADVASQAEMLYNQIQQGDVN